LLEADDADAVAPATELAGLVDASDPLPTPASGVEEAPEPSPSLSRPGTGEEPSKAGAFLGKVKQRVSETTKLIKDSERVQAGIGFVKERSRAIGESGHVKQGVQLVKGKTRELAESEKVQKGIDFVKGKTKEIKESELVKTTAKVMSETARLGMEMAAERAGWRTDQIQIQSVRESAGPMAWRGSARDTLNMAAHEELWKDIKIQGAEEVTVPARGEYTIAHVVTKGSKLRWRFRVKEHSIGFGVRTRRQEESGGSHEEEVLALTRYDSADAVSGSWVADEDYQVVLAFDNKQSVLTQKKIAYLVGVGSPSALAGQAEADFVVEGLPALSTAACSSTSPPVFGGASRSLGGSAVMPEPAVAPAEAAPVVDANLLTGGMGIEAASRTDVDLLDDLVTGHEGGAATSSSLPPPLEGSASDAFFDDLWDSIVEEAGPLQDEASTANLIGAPAAPGEVADRCRLRPAPRTICWAICRRRPGPTGDC